VGSGVGKVLLSACLIVGGFAVANDGEPTQASCLASVAAARKLAERLPAGDVSRYFAERDLQQAMTEAGNGEFDDCLQWAEEATVEIREHRHTLKPGETLNVRPAEE
jgi:hypothetical protein